MATLGIPKSEVDQMEVWEVAASIGVEDTEPEPKELTQSEIIRRRIEASERGESEPQLGAGAPSTLMQYGQGFFE